MEAEERPRPLRQPVTLTDFRPRCFQFRYHRHRPIEKVTEEQHRSRLRITTRHRREHRFLFPSPCQTRREEEARLPCHCRKVDFLILHVRPNPRRHLALTAVEALRPFPPKLAK
jgi:hypothetical protein